MIDTEGRDAGADAQRRKCPRKVQKAGMTGVKVKNRSQNLVGSL